MQLAILSAFRTTCGELGFFSTRRLLVDQCSTSHPTIMLRSLINLDALLVDSTFLQAVQIMGCHINPQRFRLQHGIVACLGFSHLPDLSRGAERQSDAKLAALETVPAAIPRHFSAMSRCAWFETRASQSQLDTSY